MGILTDPNNSRRSAFGSFIMKHYLKISWLSYFSGLVFLFVLPHPWYSHKTYFSENALLPGLVTSEFDQHKSTKRYYEDLKEENSRYPGQAPFPWLEAQFKQLGLDVYRQEFELQYPLANNTFTGSNVYAILRAPKASSTEALVLCAPHRPPNSPHQSTDAGIAIILAAAKYFRNQIYWAKDIIFLITEHEFLGIQAWLEAYHGVRYGDGSINPGNLVGRAGSIQAAINLEIETPDITHLNVKVEGLNGQLPNLDLVNLVNRLVLREGLHPMFQGMEDHPRPESYNGYMRSLSTMFSMMTSQSTGVPSGNHGLFHRFGIEAVTLEGLYHRRKGRMKADFLTLGRIVEGVFRSLNNLLERFHQSFFFYLLCGGSRYISIGMYMPMFGLLAIGFLITALGIWFNLLAKLNDKKDVEITEVPVPYIVPENFTKTLPIFFIVHFIGLVGYHMPTIATRFGEAFHIGPEDSVPICLGSFSFILLLLPFLDRPNLSLPAGPDTWQVAKCLLNLELAAIAGCCSLVNISLTTFLTILLVPLALTVKPYTGWRRMVLVLYTLMCHPLILGGIASTVDTIRTFPSAGAYKLTVRSLEAWQRGVMFSIVDSYIYGNVMYDLASILLLPAWIILYLLCLANPRAAEDAASTSLSQQQQTNQEEGQSKVKKE
eukprot:TRINITY_DN2439_c0_g1_i6.p1 TRINITY_DN2439_c0_g1~~TRINITY_DN2439_c0_g1_i6.p1  ORF type:complete len:660 (-),score=121.18 TRINITY_DN2439_c0_g1_i6:861-2840(-)